MCRPPFGNCPFRFCLRLFFVFFVLPPALIRASENVPYRPFAQWAEVPARSEWVIGAVYDHSDAGNVWVGDQQHSLKTGGQGTVQIDQGFAAIQYGITERWAADLNVGYTMGSWQHLPAGSADSTKGLMDWAFGVRYQMFHEDLKKSRWIPTLTFRAGAVLPGSYDQRFPFSPGLSSAAIQPELLLRKHFGWEGFGCYGDALYRWNRTTGNDQYILAFGLMQQFKGWELDFGWRHLQTLSGSDITIDPDQTVHYPRDPRENSEALEAGLSYTTAVRRFRYAVHTRAVLDGNNADDKLWFGLSVDFPFGGKPPKNEAAE